MCPLGVCYVSAIVLRSTATGGIAAGEFTAGSFYRGSQVDRKPGRMYRARSEATPPPLGATPDYGMCGDKGIPIRDPTTITPQGPPALRVTRWIEVE